MASVAHVDEDVCNQVSKLSYYQTWFSCQFIDLQSENTLWSQ